MEDDDGYSGVHLARTLTDLLLEPYFLHWRDYAVAERSVDARRIPDSIVLDAPKVDSHRTRRQEFDSVDNSPGAPLAGAYTAQQMLDLWQFLRIETRLATLKADVCANLAASIDRMHLCPSIATVAKDPSAPSSTETRLAVKGGRV